MKLFRTKTRRILGLAMALGLQTASADLLGQIDTFDSGLSNWSTQANPTNPITGGPAGIGDGFLQVSRDSAFPFHLGAHNKTQWQGNYSAAGVTGIHVDLNAISGPSALTVRLVLWGDGGVWASTSTTSVAAGWNSYSFGLTAADLVFVSTDTNAPAFSGGGTGILADTLANVNIIQLRHDSATPTVPGNHPPHVVATLGIDNFEAIPEPSTLLLLLTAAGGLMIWRSRCLHGGA